MAIKAFDKRDALALLLLRLGLAWFLFVWAVNKIFEPGQYVLIWGYFHGIDIGANLPYFMGGAQIVICIAAALGLWRTVSYGLLFAMHLMTVFVILPSLAAPFVIENNYPAYFSVNRPSMGGPGGTVNIVGLSENWAGLDPTSPTIIELMISHYGQERATEIFNAFLGAYSHSEEYLLRVRRDLSSPQ